MVTGESLAGWKPEIQRQKLTPFPARNRAARKQALSDVRKRKVLRLTQTFVTPLLSFDGAYTAAMATFKFLVLCAHEKNRLPVAVID